MTALDITEVTEYRGVMAGSAAVREPVGQIGRAKTLMGRQRIIREEFSGIRGIWGQVMG